VQAVACTPCLKAIRVIVQFVKMTKDHMLVILVLVRGDEFRLCWLISFMVLVTSVITSVGVLVLCQDQSRYVTK
jgi:hypothetical protein